MVVTADDLVEETRSLLFSGQESEGNRLLGAIDDGVVETFSLKYPPGSIMRGAVVSIGLEDIRIWDITGTSVTACERGVNGTVPAQHDDGTYIEVRAKFSKFRVFRALNQELIDLSAPVNGLFQVKSVDITYNSTVKGYDFESDVSSILEVRHKTSGSDRAWPVVKHYYMSRLMDTTEFASGTALFLDEGQTGLPIRVRYASDFSPLTSLDDDVFDVAGLPLTCMDIPPLGAAIRLHASREIKRNFTEAQYDPNRLEEIPPGAELAASRGLQLLKQQRIIAEKARLDSYWPKYRR